MTENVFLADQEQRRRQTDFLLATIVSADDTTGTAKICLDGMTDPNEKSYKALGSAWPLAAGDRVVLLKQSGTYLILGRIGRASGGGGGPEPSTSLPLMDGSASAGAADTYARGDHVHPVDTSRAPAATTVTDVAYDAANKKITKTINGTTSDVVAADTAPTTNSTNLITSGAVHAKATELMTAINRRIVGWSAEFAIPAEGSSVTITSTYIKAYHELLRWNFSSSPENCPPVNLKWETADGSFTITNLGGTTSEKIRPVFGYVF